MKHTKFTYETSGEKFYDITDQVKKSATKLIDSNSNSGILFVHNLHTSCGLTINEAYDPSAKNDLEVFLQRLCPRDADFISHTSEGPDDSPSHMKNLIAHQNLSFIVEDGEILLGTWQGIYLCEFRDSPKKREIYLKFIAG